MRPKLLIPADSRGAAEWKFENLRACASISTNNGDKYGVCEQVPVSRERGEN